MRKWMFRSVFGLFLLAFGSALLVPGCSLVTLPPQAVPILHGQAENAPLPVSVRQLRLLSLNLAHGRKDGFSQLLLSDQEIRANLHDIARLLKQQQPDLAALQEADGHSFWNGGFDHVQYLADLAGFGYAVRGEHVGGMNLSYGTALLSRWPLRDALSVTFSPSPPTPRKGFVQATAYLPDTNRQIQVVSLHLDFLNPLIRQAQIEELMHHLTPRHGPLVIMGDFNTDWGEGSAVKILAERLNLRTYQPEAENLASFPLTGKRLDWILVSPELHFVSYQVLPDVLSDHQAVVAVVEW